jgi:tetratricopeptide (TPR) repeat protein
MQYQCIQCDERFESDDTKPRCPKCLRGHPMALGAQAAVKPARKVHWLLPVVGTLVLGLGALGYARWKTSSSPVGEALGELPLSVSALREQLHARGVQEDAHAKLFEANAAMIAEAKRIVASLSGDLTKAAAVQTWFAAALHDQAYARWTMLEPRAGATKLATDTFAVLTKKGGRAQLYPIEVASCAAAMLRAVDVPAMLAEVYAYPSEQQPIDPSGRFGYFAVALPDGKGGLSYFDVYGQRNAQPAPNDVAAVSDVQAVGVVTAIDGLAALANNADPQKALAATQAALKLFPTSASVRSAHGTALMATGGMADAESELQAAAQQRSDAARHHNLGMLLLSQGDPTAANRELARALALTPDYAAARVTLAGVLLANGDRDQALAELRKAQALDGSVPALPMVWAQYYLGGGDASQALASAQQAVRAMPQSPQAHLLLGRVYRELSNYDAMRAEARTVMAMLPANQQASTKVLIERVLGPTALEPAGADDTANDAKPEPLPEPGSLKLGDSTSKLQLGGSDSKLKLKLNP